MDCGPTCLRMVAKHYGKHFNTDGIREVTGYSKEGVSLLGISLAAEKMGFRTRGVQITVEQLIRDAPVPAILHWNQNHFVVFVNSSGWKNNLIKIADPGKGLLTFSKKDFVRYWISKKNEDGNEIGTALLLEPTPYFYEQEGEREDKLNWNWVLQYLKKSKWMISHELHCVPFRSTVERRRGLGCPPRRTSDKNTEVAGQPFLECHCRGFDQ